MTAVAVALLWLAAGYRLFLLRRAAGFINISYAAAAAGIAAAFTAKAAETTIDAAAGPYIGDLTEHGLVVVGGVSAQMFLLALKTGRPPRRAAAVRLAIAAAVLVAMTIAFLIAPIHHRVIGDLDEVFGQLSSITVYRLVFNTYLTYVLIDNIRLCRRYAAIPGDIGRTASLTLVGWGSAVALAYSSSRIVYVLADLVLRDRPTIIRTIGSAAAALGLCALAIGMLAPRIVPGLASWLEAQRGTRRLGPLWRDLTDAFPLVKLTTGSAATARRAELRYDRRLLEVSEALAQARVPDTELADSLGGDPLDRLAHVLRRSREHWTDVQGVAAASLLPTAPDVSAERRQILALARAYRAAAASDRIPASTGAIA